MALLFRTFFLMLFIFGSLEAGLSSGKLESLADKEQKKKKPVTLEATFYKYEDSETEKIPLYKFSAKNASSEKKYKLVFVNMNGQAVEFDCLVKPNGNLYYSEEQLFIHGTTGYMKGEWSKVFLLSNSKTDCAKAVITPFPYTYEQNGYKAEVAIADPQGSVVIILAEGFEPEEEVALAIKMNGKLNQSKAKANTKGKVLFSFDTGYDEKNSDANSGEVYIFVKGLKGDLKINHPWGKKYRTQPFPGELLKQAEQIVAEKETPVNPAEEKMIQPTPQYLYKILSIENWKNSQTSDRLQLPHEDDAFIHLAMEDQVEKIAEKYWPEIPEYVILKITTSELPGKLLFETNPGGSKKYYHLYEGYIPLKSVIDHKIVKKS